MASAIIGGLTSQGHPASQIEVVEPWDQARAALRERFGIEAAATPGPNWRERRSSSGPLNRKRLKRLLWRPRPTRGQRCT